MALKQGLDREIIFAEPGLAAGAMRNGHSECAPRYLNKAQTIFWLEQELTLQQTADEFTAHL